MAKITYENLKKVLESNNEHMKEFVYDVITNFSPTSVNVARILSHLTNKSIHVTEEDKQIWNDTYRRAVKYADDIFANMTSIELKAVAELPSSEINKGCIYLLETDTANVYEQFIYSNDSWVSLGPTSIDMSQYYTKDDIDELIEELKMTSQHTHTNLEILELITAAFTTEDKTIVDKLKSMDVDSISEHMNDTNIHVNEEDKSAIETAKQLNAQELLDHLVNSTIHVSTNQTKEWDNMINVAKEYTDSEIEKLSIISSVEDLPENPSTKVIYLVKNSEPTIENMYLKYIYVEGNWERLGGGTSELPDMTMYCTVLAMQQYVAQKGHDHVNKEILDNTEVAFTTSIMNDIDTLIETKTLTENHMANNTIHITREQSDILNDLETTISTLVARSLAEQLGETLRIKIVDILPSFLADVEEGVIYFVRRSSSQSTTDSLETLSDEELADINISRASKSINYDKYIWSSENECWEIFSPGSMELSDAEIAEILNF